jgi:hypothetical protein
MANWENSHAKRSAVLGKIGNAGFAIAIVDIAANVPADSAALAGKDSSLARSFGVVDRVVDAHFAKRLVADHREEALDGALAAVGPPPYQSGGLVVLG